MRFSVYRILIFLHVFKKEAGQSFTNYVNFARINKAKDLLKNSDLKINEIAAMVGLEMRIISALFLRNLRENHRISTGDF